MRVSSACQICVNITRRYIDTAKYIVLQYCLLEGGFLYAAEGFPGHHLLANSVCVRHDFYNPFILILVFVRNRWVICVIMGHKKVYKL